MRSAENTLPFLHRFYIYQKERFPFIGHGMLIFAFSFSAVSYSRICRGMEGFISWEEFLPGYFLTFSLFFLLRVFDEFKDREDDAKYRTYLPVPRGLITLKELKIAGLVTVFLQVLAILAFHPAMLAFYIPVMLYLLLMRVEFFVPGWLKDHQEVYVFSHMLIIPLVDIYASGLDWYLDNARPPAGLLFFFGVSFFNGIVLEVGRKLKAPEKEEEGVLSYTKHYGLKKAVWVWLSCLLLTLAMAVAASYEAGYGSTGYFSLGLIFAVTSLPAFLFLKKPSPGNSKLLEYASAFWTILMYLTLGALPMLAKLVS